MALFNIFKKKPASAPKELRRGEERKKVTPKEVKKEAVKEGVVVPLKPKKASQFAYRILKGSHITEKATDLTKFNQYVFDVYERTNKPEIKKAIEDLYGVSVVSLSIIKIPPKKRRLGRIEGWRKGHKKAIVRVAEGQKIEILPR